jgi:ERCC4-related helicase
MCCLLRSVEPRPRRQAGELIKLIKTRHSKEKLLIFTQFADTARYLKAQLTARKIPNVEEATGQSARPHRPCLALLPSFQRQARLGAFR